MRPSAFLLVVLVAFLLAPSLRAAAPEAVPPPAWRADPKFQAALDEAHRLARQRQYAFALDDLRKASKIAGGKDIPVVVEIYDLQIKSGAYKDAVNTASMISELVTNPKDKSNAATRRGQALMLQAGDKNKPDLLAASDASFKAALADNPKNATALYFDGRVLARLGQTAAARTAFQQCVSCLSPSDPTYLRAQHFAENPALALAKMAPAFTVTALDGSRFTLDNMGGKVVLIDFWATWCGPCNRELPHMQKIAREFAGQPLVILSISWDSDESKWRDFIAKHDMTWTQYRDADHTLSNLFGINAIPHYFTIDSDGVLTAEMLGEDSDVEGKLKKLISRAKAAPHASTDTASVTHDRRSLEPTASLPATTIFGVD